MKFFNLKEDSNKNPNYDRKKYLKTTMNLKDSLFLQKI